MSEFCWCGKVIVGRCTSCQQTVCAQHAWNGPLPQVDPMMRFERGFDGDLYVVPAGPIPTPSLPSGGWRAAQRDAMLEAAEKLAPNGELLCRKCVEPRLVAVAEQIPLPPEPPVDLLERLEFFRARRAELTLEESSQFYDDRAQAQALFHTDAAFRGAFSQALYRRLADTGQRSPCGDHQPFDCQYHNHDYSKSPHDPFLGVTVDLPGVQFLHSVSADGRYWRCHQHVAPLKARRFGRSELRVAWECHPREPDELLGGQRLDVGRAVSAFCESGRPSF